MKFLIPLLIMTTSALAADWTSYANPRFGATIDIPPGFVNDVDPPENGDGLTYHADNGAVELLVFGNNITADSVAQEFQNDLQYSRDDKWNITYSKLNPKAGFAAYSGSKDDRIFYAKEIATCKRTQTVQFRIEYPMQKKIEMDSIIARLAKSLHGQPTSDCP